MTLDGVEIAPLPKIARLYVALARHLHRRADKDLAQVDLHVVAHQLGGAADIFPREGVPLAQQVGEVIDDPLGPGKPLRVADYHQLGAGRRDLDVELIFDLTEVLVPGAEKGFQTLVGNRDLDGRCRGRRRCQFVP